MRGSPIIQAATVIIIFVALWFAGMSLIEGRDQPNKKPTSTSANTGELRVDVEIYFSEKPASYTLRRPGNGWDKKEHILTIMGNDENPALHEFTMRGADDNVVWLDVTWPQEIEKGRHFIEVVR